MNNVMLAPVEFRNQNRESVGRLLSLAIKGLVPMFDRDQHLFCYSLKVKDGAMAREGHSHRYTMMTLMGLHRLQESGVKSPFDMNEISTSLLRDLTWVDNLGDLGVLLWTLGIVCPERFPELQSRLELETALHRYRGGRQAVTMELSWFLTGLAYCALAYPEKRQELEVPASQVYKLLTKNQGDRGFFGHQSTSVSFAGMLRGRIGSFADQVYPIYALTQFSKAFQHPDALGRALRCANGICEEQGSRGQWWWHYDAASGRVAEGYPVFSVHQHAMAPMTLFAFGDAVKKDFTPFIYKGLQWINRKNELDFEMENQAHSLVWRCIYRSRGGFARYAKARLGKFPEPIEHGRRSDLKVLYECRPYELGWLLYAFAKRLNTASRPGE